MMLGLPMERDDPGSPDVVTGIVYAVAKGE